MHVRGTVLGVILAATALCACARSAHVGPAESARRQALVQALADLTTRDAAYCELLRLASRAQRRDSCDPVSDVVAAPQSTGAPLSLVFTRPAGDIEREPIRRGPAGPFEIIDSNGLIVRPFAAANFVDHAGELFTSSPTGEIALGNVFGVSHGNAFEAGHWSVQTLHIIPVTREQQSVLSVVLGPPTFGFEDKCAGDFWSWRYRDVDGDGRPEIEIGPRLDANGRIQPAATFRWSISDRKYIGPPGSIAEQFLQFQLDASKALDAYADAWRRMPERRTGHRVSQCVSAEPPPNLR